MVFIEALVLLPILLILFYKWATVKYGVLKERDIPHEKPKPFLGNVRFKVLMGKISVYQDLIETYEQYKDKKFYGVYSFRDPVITVRDTELIMKICVKNFDNFSNHKSIFTQIEGNPFEKSLIALRDRKWKEMRNTLTPSFTGSKMRLMFELINECSQQGTNYIDGELKATQKNELDLEMKDYFTRFTNDVIASVAFGIQVNSYVDKSNKFFTIGKAVTQFTTLAFIKMFLFGMIPKIMKSLRIKVMDEEKMNYLNGLVFDAMKYRKEHNIIRPDMIHLLMEAKKHFEETKSVGEHTADQAEFNDEDLLAQCLLFFFAGYETVSVCLCFTTYEIAVNADVQQRLYEEILEVGKELDGKPLNYDAVMKMKYMDMVLSESLRLWTPAVATDRECSADVDLTDDEGNVLMQLKKGDHIFVPIAGLHRDAEFYPNPNSFEPERFSEENKHNIKPFTYMPFGLGPRQCIANRLALMEVKCILYHILLKFELQPNEKTVKDMMGSLSGFTLKPKDGFCLKFVPRKV